MILSTSEIKEIILNNPANSRLNKGREYKKKMCRHIHGEGLGDHMELIKGFERTKDLRDLRAKYSKSNKDLFSRLIRPMDKVFSAKGGSIYYNLSEQQEKTAVQISNKVKNGVSIRKWIELQWKNQSLCDPFGCTFIEMLPVQQARIAKSKGESFVYPTYKSVDVIYDEMPKGNKFEYIVFHVSKQEKKNYGLDEKLTYYRVVDDAFDYIVKKENDEVTILPDFIIQNWFGEVPAIRNSDIVSYENDGVFLSFFDDVIEIADQFLLDGSIRVIHKFHHGFPKYVEIASDCPECGGNGVYEGNKCSKCKGSGKYPMLNVSDVKLMNFPSKEDHAVMPKDVAAYISPDKVYHDMSTADLQDLENTAFVTAWGTQSRLRSQGMAQTGDNVKTATEIVDEIKPQADRLVIISEMAEARHKYILDLVIKTNLGIPNYQGSMVNYGRRYMLEGPDAIWMKYSDARTKGAPQSVLDTLLNEYYEANNQSDPVGLAMAKKLMYVEPFVHFTAASLKALTPDEKDYKAKLYYSEWLSTKTDAQLLSGSVQELKDDLYAYSAGKELKQEAAPVV